MAKKLKSLVKPVTTPRPHAKLPKLSKEKVTSTNLRNKKAKAKLTTKAKKFPGPTTKGKLPKLSKDKVKSTNLRNKKAKLSEKKNFFG